MLTLDAKQNLSKIVAEEEVKTSAELVTVVANSSPEKLVVDLNTALSVGTQVSIVMMVLQGLVWLKSPNLFTWAMMIILLVFCISSLVFLKYLAKTIKSKSAYTKAVEEYQNSVISKTRGATGVLLFVSAQEREMVILADQAIHSQVPSDTWDKIVKEGVKTIKKQNLESGIALALREIGKVCAGVSPVKPEDVNEISNEVIVRD